MSNYDPLTSDLSVIPMDTVQQWLVAAVTAFNELSTGGRVVRASYTQGDGMKSVEYKTADITTLRAYIDKLKAHLGISGRRGPMRPQF